MWAPVMAGQPRAEHQEAGGQGKQPYRVEPIKQPSRQRQERKAPPATRPGFLGVEFFKGQTEE